MISRATTCVGSLALLRQTTCVGSPALLRPARVVALAACVLAVLARDAPAQEPAADPQPPVERPGDGVVLRLPAGRLRVLFRAPDIVRVTLAADSFSTRPSLAVLPDPGPDTPERRARPVPLDTRVTADSIVLRSAAAVVRIDRRNGALAITDRTGGVLLRAAAPPPDALTPYRDTADPTRPAWSIRQRFRLTPDEGVYGLGQYQDGVLDWRGEHVLLEQSNTMAAIPFAISTRSWGLLWDNYSKTTFDDDSTGTTFWSEVADQLDYYIIVARRPAEAIAGYRRLTGKAPMYPRWAFGYWQSKERYDSRRELLDVAGEFRRRQLPIDALVQDWAYWGIPLDRFSGMVWDSARYPDPAGMLRQLHGDHVHLMASIWGALGSSTGIFLDMQRHGWLYPRPFWADGGRLYDAYDPEARDLYWSYAKRGLLDVGLDAWWMDATEPEFRSTDDRYLTELALEANGRNALGSFARYLTPFSLVHARGVYEHQRATTSDKRVVILTRSAFIGQQRYATTLWPGDLWSSWGVFRNQIAGGLNTSMAGFPYWNTDIGGFISAPHFPQGTADSAFRELHVRWFQFGAFNPMFRTHGTNTPREPWRFGEPGTWSYDALAKADRLRYRLLPYVYSLARDVYARDGSFLRALPLEFPDDTAGRRLGTEFLFGPALLVNPVTRPMRYAPAHEQEWIPMRDLLDSAGVRPGLRLDFFRGTSLDTLAATRPTELFNLTWSGSLADQVLDRPFSVRYTGSVRAEEPGDYTFVLNADSGVRLWLDGRILVDAWEQTGRQEYRVEVALAEPTKHPLRLEYRQATPNTTYLVLEWITPTQRRSLRAADGRWTTYLPAGARWYDFWTGERFAGGQRVTRPAPIDRIPLFVRAGSIVPLGPDLQYADEKLPDPLEIRVYPGADGAFTLYEDQGDGYGYEKGVYATILFRWNDASRTLTIGRRAGSFPGMLRQRSFRIVQVRPGQGTGVEPAGQARVVRYVDSALEVRLQQGGGVAAGPAG